MKTTLVKEQLRHERNRFDPAQLAHHPGNPVSAFGRLVGQAWELWRDKAQGGKAGHACYLAGPPRNASPSGMLNPE
jgi:hypothetical protein